MPFHVCCLQDIQPQASSAASAAAEFKQPAPPAQHAIDIKAEPLERAQHESAASADPNSQQQAQQQNIVWQVGSHIPGLHSCASNAAF